MGFALTVLSSCRKTSAARLTSSRHPCPRLVPAPSNTARTPSSTAPIGKRRSSSLRTRSTAPLLRNASSLASVSTFSSSRRNTLTSRVWVSRSCALLVLCANHSLDRRASWIDWWRALFPPKVRTGARWRQAPRRDQARRAARDGLQRHDADSLLQRQAHLSS